VTWEQTTKGDFGPQDVALTLEATFLRRVFMKAAIALVHADGVYTDNERRAIGEFAEAFGMSHTEFGELEQAAKKVDLNAAE
jgi:tellurite resistance protein